MGATVNNVSVTKDNANQVFGDSAMMKTFSECKLDVLNYKGILNQTTEDVAEEILQNKYGSVSTGLSALSGIVSITPENKKIFAQQMQQVFRSSINEINPYKSVGLGK